MFDATNGLAPELLAPAGGPAALRAAVNNGADAVYLGLKTLNARRGAENFTLDELAEATRYAHLRGRRVYLTANILTLQTEMRDALGTIDSAWTAGVDAVIVQDLGLLRLLRRELPDVRVHASTQMNAHNAATVATLAEMGVSRVTLARELALEEMSSLVAGTPVELECFVHGALCFCYSGQCLMSSMIGGRSANRGLCAQPCRLPYHAIVGSEAVKGPGPYLLSPKDLAGIDVLPGLVRSGVRALKIEGRMKSAEYVALVVGVYRAALDRAVAEPADFRVSPAEWEILEEAFNRGFTEGSLTGRRGEARMSYLRPNNRGVPVGRVVETGDGRAVIALDRALDAEDTLEFWTGRGRFAQRAGTMRVEGREAEHAPAGSRASVVIEGRAAAGDRVFRVANASLLSAARRSYTKEAGAVVPVEIAVTVRVGSPASVSVSAQGATVRSEGAVVEEARTKRVTAEEIVTHVGRLGGTAFSAGSWEVDLDPRAGIGFSELHRLRREAVDLLQSELLRPWTDRRSRKPEALLPRRAPAASGGLPMVVAAVGSHEAARACLDAGADRVLLAVTAADRAASLPAAVEPLLPRIAHDTEVPALLRWTEHADAITCGNPGLISAAAERGSRVSADWGINAVNPWTCEALEAMGAQLVWTSPELSGRQLADLAASSPVPLGVLVYGRVELMVAEHCVIGSVRECEGGACATCSSGKEPWALRDEKAYAFPVRTDAMGRSHLYNSVTLDLSRSAGELLAAGVAAVRLDLHTESPDSAARAVAHWLGVLQAADADGAWRGPDLASPATTGHFYRGVR